MSTVKILMNHAVVRTCVMAVTLFDLLDLTGLLRCISSRLALAFYMYLRTNLSIFIKADL